MKLWQKRLLGISMVPIVWGIIIDLRHGLIASFITRVIVVTLIGLLLLTAFEKLKVKFHS